MLTQERQAYHCDTKEGVLNALLAPSLDTPILKKEVAAILGGLTTPDYFEYMRPDLLRRTAAAYSDILSEFSSTSKMPTDQSVQALRQESVQAFLHESSQISATDKSQLYRYVHAKRKTLGMVQTRAELKNVCDIIQKSHEAHNPSPQNQDVFLYMGTFNPFPHSGHMEVANTALNYARLAHFADPRVIVSATSQHRWKPGTSDSFQQRLDQLHNAFFYSPGVSIANMPASDESSNLFYRQSLLARISGTSRLRFIIGSDSFIGMTRLAELGDAFATPFFQHEQTEFYVSQRPKDNPEQLDRAKNIAASMGALVHPLSAPRYQLSGTFVRGLSSKEMLDHAPNQLVREYMEKLD